MNLLLFEKDELSGNRLHLQGDDRRALHIRKVLKLQPGDSVRVGEINGKAGEGRIVLVDEHSIEVEIELTETMQPDRNITLILALPRPIMLQRILKQATVLGVRTFHLIRSEKVQKSYFQSNVLQEENIRSLLLQGLEQAMDTRLPEVHVHHRFKPFVEDVVPEINATSLLLADPGSEKSLTDLHHDGVVQKDLTLAIGPEGGWNDFEINQFETKGFHGFTFGERIMHVDTAALVLLSQILLLQDL